MTLKLKPLSKEYEPKTTGLTYLSFAIRGQSKGRTPRTISIPYKQAKEIAELWKNDKAKLESQEKLITQLRGRLSVSV